MTTLALCALIPILLARPGLHDDALDAFRRATRAAKPGDRLTLPPGVHHGPLWLENIQGDEKNPIVISGASPGTPDQTVIEGATEAIHLSRCNWVVVEDVTLRGCSGNGINVDEGGPGNPSSKGIVLRRLSVSDIGGKDDCNCDGIKLSGLSGFRVESCTVTRWGGGGSGMDLVGCSDGVITSCTLIHQPPHGASGIQLKGGSHAVVVEATRFENAGTRALNIGGSTGLQYFRPAAEGHEAADITVRGCTIVGSETAAAFVGIDGATFTGNTIYHPTRWPFRILQENRAEGFVPSRGGVLSHNLIVVAEPGALNPNIGDATDPASFVFDSNFWYCDSDPARSTPELPSPEAGGIYGQDPRLSDPAHGDYTPSASGPARSHGARTQGLPAPR